MSLVNSFIINLDLKDNNYIAGPVITQSDTIQFVVNVTDDGLPFDLTEMTTASIAHTRPDGVVVLKSGTKTGDNQITFDLGSSEISVIGRVDAKVQMYDSEDRVSTLNFGYKVLRDPSGADYIPSEDEITLIQQVLGDGPQILSDAQEATTAANEASIIANAAATNANATESDVQAAESARVTAENTRVSQESSRQTSESNRASAESTRATSESGRVGAESARASSETARASAESARITSESGRVGAESARVSAETSRTSSESTRVAAEVSRNNAELIRDSSETDRLGSETDRVAAESVRDSAESGRVSAESTRVTNESTRQSNESTRQDNEASRLTAEEDRVSNEVDRGSNESARQTAETNRSIAESSRDSAETIRANSEVSRQSSEETRDFNESARIVAEGLRTGSESARVSAESLRVSSETGRTNSETSRVSAETGRSSAESARATAETNRSSAESTRLSNESTRQSQESTRQSQESTRQTNETTRQTNESSRESAEDTRSDNETVRESNEDDRVSNESTRQSNESTRQSQESTRQSNETTRGSSESSRVGAETARANSESSRVSAESSRVAAEEDRNENEDNRVSQESTRQSNESDRVGEESTRQSNESTRQSQESTRQSNETTRSSSESSRVSAESSRVAAEEDRNENEDNRVSQESTRQSNESDRVGEELSRASAETTRGSNESTRQSQESTRQTNETTRQTNEGTRGTNESTRQTQESTRQSNESTRQSNETTRELSEYTRSDNETVRESNEDDRVSNESTRQSNESTRQSNESTRVSEESTRQSEETTRQSNETVRESNEDDRVSNESTRQSNESTRQSNESTRVSAENLRVSNESTRQSQETSRQSQESTRQTNETTRGSNESTRQSQETTRQSQESTRQTNTANAIDSINEVRDSYVFLGDYNPLTSYVVNNQVRHNQQTYICIQDSTGNVPTNQTYWELFAAKGLDGEGSGSVLSVTSSNSDISVADQNENPVLTLNTGTGANQIVKRDGSGNIEGSISGNAATVTTNANLTGDVVSVGNATSISTGVIVNSDINNNAGIAATKIANGSVSNAEFQRLVGVSSGVQAQLDSKAMGVTKTYNSVVGDTGLDDWYSLFVVTDQVSPVYCNLKAYAHSSISFIASVGYQGNHGKVNVLSVTTQGSPLYKYIKGLRILENGTVQIKLDGAGVTTSITAQIIGNGAAVSFQSTLSRETGSPTVAFSIDPLVNNSMVNRGDYYVGSDKVWHEGSFDPDALEDLIMSRTTANGTIMVSDYDEFGYNVSQSGVSDLISTYDLPYFTIIRAWDSNDSLMVLYVLSTSSVSYSDNVLTSSESGQIAVLAFDSNIWGDAVMVGSSPLTMETESLMRYYPNSKLSEGTFEESLEVSLKEYVDQKNTIIQGQLDGKAPNDHSHSASDVTLADTGGHFTSTDVEGALVELSDTMNGHIDIVSAHHMYAENSSANDTYTVTIPGVTDYSQILGKPLIFKTTVGNSSGASLNVNGLGALTLSRGVSTALVTGDIPANKLVMVVYDGTRFQILSQGGDVTANTATQTLTNKTLTAPKLASNGFIADTSGNELIKATPAVTSAVNEVTVKNAATGNAPGFAATGNDTDIDFNLESKGTGKVKANGVEILTTDSDIPANKVAISDSEGNFTATDVEGALSELFQSVSDGKDMISAALTDVGEPTADTDTFSKMANNITAVGRAYLGGRAWTSQESAADLHWISVCFGKGLFVAVAATDPGDRIMTSPDGITWTSRTAPEEATWQCVCFGNDLFVAVASGGQVMTSPDGITWTSRVTAANNQWRSVCFAEGLFVAVSSSGSGNRVMTSPDGITWNIGVSAANSPWQEVCHGNGLFVAVSSSPATYRAMTSPDGFTWTAQTISGTATAWYSVCYGKGLYVAVGANGRSATSTDGETWELKENGTTKTWAHVIYESESDMFIAVSNSSTGGLGSVMTSPDGVNWTIRESASENQWSSIACGNGTFVSVSSTGTGDRVMTSPLYMLGFQEYYDSVSDGLSQIAEAITGKGVPTGETDSFTTMADNIESIQLGVAVQTGSSSAGSAMDFYDYYSGSTFSKYPITVSGLSFEPNTILIYDASGFVQCAISKHPDMPLHSSGNNLMISGASGINIFKLEGVAAYINNGGFRLPVSSNSGTYEWVAYA